MKAKDVMTTSVVSIAPEAPILEAINLMLQKRISGLPVVAKDGSLVGIVTEGDFLRRSETGTQRHRPRWLEILVGPGRLASEYTHSHGRKVEEVMTTDPQTINEDASLRDVVQLMEKRQIKRVPVMCGNQIVGIISRANLLHALAGIALEARPSAQSDESIRTRIFAELAKETWAPGALVDVTVRNGIVELWGTILDWRERSALIVAAENVQGVKSVRDHLAWLEEMSGIVMDPPEDVPAEQRQPKVVSGL